MQANVLITILTILGTSGLSVEQEKGGLQQEIARLQAENAELRLKIDKQDEQLAWLKEFCYYQGIPIPLKSGEYPVVDKEFSGLKLGQSIDSIKKSFQLKTLKNNPNELSKSYSVQTDSEIIKRLGVEIYKNQLMYIMVEMKEATFDAFTDITRVLESKYKIIQRVSDKDTNVMYVVMVDGKIIDVHVSLQISPLNANLTILYRHPCLFFDAVREEAKAKKKRLQGDL